MTTNLFYLNVIFIRPWMFFVRLDVYTGIKNDPVSWDYVSNINFSQGYSLLKHYIS